MVEKIFFKSSFMVKLWSTAPGLQEVIFIGLPGPTHHYGGLSLDNRLPTETAAACPTRAGGAASAGFGRLLKSLGVEVAILPPPVRPHMGLLRQHFPKAMTTK